MNGQRNKYNCILIHSQSQNMNREEAVRSDQEVKEYMEKNKLRPMFSEFTKELLLKKPDNPVEYLISYLEKRTRRQIICIQGYDDEDRTRLANIVANKFNFKLIDVSAIFEKKDYHFQNDKIINEKVHNQLKGVEAIFKGVIISGYPNNLVQLDYVQKCGVLPDRYFVLPASKQKLKQKYSKDYDAQEVESLVDRNKLEFKELSENLGQMLDELPLVVEEAAEKLCSTINIKARKTIPYDSPRAIFIHPPYLQPATLQKVIHKFSLHHISVAKSLKKLSSQPKFNEYVEKYIRKNGSLSREIELALIETETRTSAAKNKGYVLSGWPYQKSSLMFLKEKFLSPHLVFIFDIEPKECDELFNNLAEGNPQLFPVSPKPSLQDFKKQMKVYSQMVQELQQNHKVQILPWNEGEKQVLKTYESLIENPKIYC